MDPLQHLLQAPIFEGLSVEDLESLRPAVRTRRYERGSYVFREGDPGSHLYVVLRGQVQIGRIGPQGGELIFAMAGPGEVFGELSLFVPDGERTADAQTLEPTECMVIGRAPLLRFLTTRPTLLIRIIAVLSSYIRRKDASMAEAVFLDILGRVASKLVELADTRGRPTPAGIVIDLPLRQRTLVGTAWRRRHKYAAPQSGVSTEEVRNGSRSIGHRRQERRLSTRGHASRGVFLRCPLSVLGR